MIGHADLGAALPELCRRMLQIGIGLALQSTLLLGLALLVDRALRRRGPALRSFLYRAVLVATLVGGLASLIAGQHFQPLWSVSLPLPGKQPALVVSSLGPPAAANGAEALASGAAADP